ncbi:hypothetical protein CLAIMM_07376 isoform 2 [Cladophialophora immunda]|nr:hypothetical protein CLAIMM_07376 isoform 2 [Cladophialophora immunda]
MNTTDIGQPLVVLLDMVQEGSSPEPCRILLRREDAAEPFHRAWFSKDAGSGLDHDRPRNGSVTPHKPTGHRRAAARQLSQNKSERRKDWLHARAAGSEVPRYLGT